MNRPVRNRGSRWRLKGFPDATALSGHDAAVLLNQRLAWATFETWFEGDGGRLLAVITNGERAMVMLLTDEGDPGEHAIDPGAEGVSDGYYLQNYQNDTYANCDTVEWGKALDLVRAIIDSEVWPDHVHREIDR